MFVSILGVRKIMTVRITIVIGKSFTVHLLIMPPSGAGLGRQKYHNFTIALQWIYGAFDYMPECVGQFSH